MIAVGITGGIGSGKTYVCRFFEELGIPVYYADLRAKKLMNTNKALIKEISKLFGENAYTNDGDLNRKMIGDLVFNDRELLDQLNALVHPAVRKDSMDWLKTQEENGAPYALKEAALLFESDSYEDLDRIIVVTAPTKVRIKRVMERDGVDEESVKARMENQWPEEKLIEKADFLIINDGERSVEEQVNQLHEMFTGSDEEN